jgi:DNA-directed RNA polymerase subunit N (RpoN/RPB10)
MIIPIRCFTCNKVIGNKWNAYNDLLKEMNENNALTKLGLHRYCCRRMLLSHVDIIDQLLEYPLIDMTTLTINEETNS